MIGRDADLSWNAMTAATVVPMAGKIRSHHVITRQRKGHVVRQKQEVPTSPGVRKSAKPEPRQRICCDTLTTKSHKFSCSQHPYRKGLKPCAFCGQPAEILPQSPMEGRCREWLIRCTRCPARMTVFTSFLTQVRAEWNYRKQVGDADHS